MTGIVATGIVSDTGEAGVGAAIEAAATAAGPLSAAGRDWRAALLEAVADALEQHRGAIIETADAETALGQTRLSGELTRTVYQWRLFADAVREGSFLEATIDHAADTPMGRRPDLRRMLVPIGPVAVFGASNFPLAFSVPGGDVASAAAAGCPVVIKGHEAHPRTSVLCARVMRGAASAHGAPSGTFGLVLGRSAGVALVTADAVRAVGFTGSERGGRALLELIGARPDPIPFYGELGSLNPVVVTAAAAAERGSEIGRGLAESFTLGVGQFCTKPGVVLIPAGNAGDAVVASAVAAAEGVTDKTMLTAGIAEAFAREAATLSTRGGVRTRVRGSGAPKRDQSAWLFEVDAPALDADMLVECFGPSTLVVRYDPEQLLEVLSRIPAALTTTLHHGRDEVVHPDVLGALSALGGRMVFNGFPTGVALGWAQHHGGGWPSSNSIHTSVGLSAMRRFLMPRAWQDAPDWALPGELLDGPAGLPRRLDGTLELPALEAAGRT